MQEARKELFKIPAFLLSLEIHGQIKTSAGRQSYDWEQTPGVHSWTVRN